MKFSIAINYTDPVTGKIKGSTIFRFDFSDMITKQMASRIIPQIYGETIDYARKNNITSAEQIHNMILEKVKNELGGTGEWFDTNMISIMPLANSTWDGEEFYGGQAN